MKKPSRPPPNSPTPAGSRPHAAAPHLPRRGRGSKTAPPTHAAPPARRTHWGEVADWYDRLVGDEGSEYHREVILPGILRLLEGKDQPAGRQVLDLACGQGVLCRRLAAAGYRVTGVDAAAPLIEAARRRNEQDQLPIQYAIADATQLLAAHSPALPPVSFDAVTLVLAIQNMTPLSPIWQACNALLKPAGALLLVMMHPCFRVPKQSDWVWQQATEVGESGGESQGRVVRQYLTSSKVEIQTHPGLAAHGKNSSSTTHFHRPLQAYINTLGNAGLLIDHVEEWISHKSSQAGPRKAALDRARKEIPMFLAIRARKV
jgi:2-polyprenyl-3-methyl-5-hydroxy-6-metoxy-1,4-benzoquinol methylase